MKTTLANLKTVAHPDFANPPKGSLLRLYLPETQGNSFSLDGFPAVKPGLPAACLPAGLASLLARQGQAGTHWLNRLVEIIEQWGAIGMTTNQTLFRQLVEAGALDERLRALKSEDRSLKEIYWTLYNEAATQAAKAFGEIHARWPSEGRVSQEASAFLTELDPLVQDVQRIATAMKGVGAFTKIPNLPIGPQAIQKAVAAVPVVHPNVTLVFSDRHYLDTVEGYLLGLEDRLENLRAKKFSQEQIRRDLAQIHSVNSLFVSRVDRVVDQMILRQAQDDRNKGLELLVGKVAVAQGKKVYQIFEAIFLEKPFEDPEGLYADAEGRQMTRRIEKARALYDSLKSLGANPQRLLIASSGVKSDQPYSPLLYVLPFLGPWTANTLPEGTLEAFSRFVERLSNSEVEALKKRNLMREPFPAIPTDSPDWEGAILMTSDQRQAARIGELTADQVLRQVQEKVLKPEGTSLRAICDTLRDKGAAAFTADEQATLQTLEAKLAAV